MTTTRALTEQDIPALQAAITRDTFHQGEWEVNDFIHTPTSPKVSTVIEDAQGPIAFVCFTKTLRITCVWNDEVENHRNAKAIIFGIRDAVQLARANGFTEIIITTTHDKLATFFTQVMKMKQSGSEFLLAV
jgi:hypothetical protein